VEREEEDELTECAECGDEIAPATDEAFAFGETGVLCLECALQRGGVYDALEDRWTRTPDLSGLWDERRPHP
jgi:hypothetical protein